MLFSSVLKGPRAEIRLKLEFTFNIGQDKLYCIFEKREPIVNLARFNTKISLCSEGEF